MTKKFPSEPAIYCLLGNAVEGDGWLPISSRFLLGKLSATPCADQLLSGLEIGYALTLHAQGDWGNVSEQTRAENNHAVEQGGRLLSRYCNHAGVSFFMLTKADRSATTVFLPSERDEHLPDYLSGHDLK